MLQGGRREVRGGWGWGGENMFFSPIGWKSFLFFQGALFSILWLQRTVFSCALFIYLFGWCWLTFLSCQFLQSPVWNLGKAKRRPISQKTRSAFFFPPFRLLLCYLLYYVHSGYLYVIEEIVVEVLCSTLSRTGIPITRTQFTLSVIISTSNKLLKNSLQIY